MCEVCKNILLIDSFDSPKEYLNCIAYLKALTESGEFELTDATCGFEEIKDKDGFWIDDLIYHVIRCKNCGQVYSCSVNTYRGGGGFHRGMR